MTWFRRSAHPEEDLSAYVDGQLGERARRAVETHLASCEACSTLLRELQDTKSLLSELPAAEPRRSFTLGPEFAAERRPAPAPRRMTFSFAPAVALTVLVALLFVDAMGSTGGSDEDSAAFESAGSTASRAAEPDATLAMESAEPANQADSAAGSQPSAGGEEGGSPAAALAPPGTTPEPDEAPQPMAAEGFDDSDGGAPEDASLAAGPEDSSDGLSTLRILQIAAAAAFVVSLLAMFLPRFVGRSER